MIESSISLYKLMVLYLLSGADDSLSNAQISDFIVGGEYTSYLTLQEVFAELTASNLISVKTAEHTTSYTITDQGHQTLSLLKGEISPQIRDEICHFLSKRQPEIPGGSVADASYRWNQEQGYEVHCTIREGNTTLLQLTLVVPNEAAAQVLCENWKQKHSRVYADLMQQLT
jgi:DNA-binding PadR family transcriptional regulator